MCTLSQSHVMLHYYSFSVGSVLHLINRKTIFLQVYLKYLYTLHISVCSTLQSLYFYLKLHLKQHLIKRVGNMKHIVSDCVRRCFINAYFILRCECVRVPPSEGSGAIL